MKKLLSSLLGLSLVLGASGGAMASDTELSIAVTPGVLSVGILNAAGETVAAPGVNLSGITFSFAEQNATGTLGSSGERIVVSNPTATSTWALSIAATGGDSVEWSDGASNTMDYNDPAGGARLSVDPSALTVTKISDGNAATGVTLGSLATFEEGVTSSITLASSTAADTYEQFDIQGISLSQLVPASQPPANYTLSLTLTVV